MQINLEKSRIVLVHIHGLIRGKNLELGKDSDTGGQTKYVLELGQSLSESEKVEEVIILTRLIIDKNVDRQYSQPEEIINKKLKIVRIPCGPKRYLKKESLWYYLDNFIDKSLHYFKRERKIPHIIHGHYADAGYVGSQLSGLLQIPFIFTGHSLGRVKKQRLLDKGKELGKIENQYRLTQRIEAEEMALDSASMIITSTVQEVEEQYKLYEQYQPGNMEVIPPGVDLIKFSPPGEQKIECQLISKIGNFLKDPNKPGILAIARPDERKNLSTLIKVYGESKELQNLCNLIIIPGTRESIDSLEPSQKKVITDFFKLVDNYDLYGKVAYPKMHKPEEIPLLYRWVSQNRGVFINPALTEPFGLTLLESAASGLPIIATNDGGPRDIIGLCRNGILIDPLNRSEIEKALLRVVTDNELWEELSLNGIKNSKVNYSWENHTKRYLENVQDLLQGIKPERFIIQKPKNALPDVDRLIITDIDNTLTGDDEALKKYKKLISDSDLHIGFGVATGRNKKEALKILEELGLPFPQILITSVGTEIYYGSKLLKDTSWEKQIHADKWDSEKIKTVLSDIDGLTLQSEDHQDKYKVSYLLDAKKIPKLGIVRRHLRNKGIKANVILSMGAFLDIIPIRAGDGAAIRQLSLKWGIPLDRIMVVGDSGNDESMLKGETLGVVVGNYSKELNKLKKYPRVYFSQGKYANGILEGIEFYNFLGDIQIPNNYYDQ